MYRYQPRNKVGPSASALLVGPYHTRSRALYQVVYTEYCSVMGLFKDRYISNSNIITMTWLL